MVDDYAQSFRDVLAFEKSNPNDPKVLRDFAEALIRVRDRHTNTVMFMAEAVMEMKNKAMSEGSRNGHQKQPKYMENVQYFLDRLYTSRISTRMLINQHTTLFTELDKAVSRTKFLSYFQYCPIFNFCSILSNFSILTNIQFEFFV